MDINIEYHSFAGKEKSTKLVYDRDTLIECEYFRGIFDTTECGSIIDIDLTFVSYLKGRHISLMFELQFRDWEKLDHLLHVPKNDAKLNIVIQNEAGNNNDELKVNLGLANLHISYMHTLGIMIDYLAFEKAKSVLVKCLDNYCSLFNYKKFRVLLKSLSKYRQKERKIKSFLDKLVPTLSESCTLYLSDTMTIDKQFYNQVKKSYYRIFIGQFAVSLYQVFLWFTSLGEINKYNQIIETAQAFMHKKHDNLFNMNQLQYPFNETDLRFWDLGDMYNFINSNQKLVAFNNKEYFDIYHHYEILNYVNGRDLFDCLNILDFDNSAINRTIISYDDVTARFKYETKGIFDDFVWEEVYMFGPFFYKLLNGLPIENSILYIVCASNKSYEYVKDYLSYLDAYYYDERTMCYYLIKDLMFDVTVSYDNVVPIGNEFDWECITYDGTNFKTTIQGLVLLKYKISSSIGECNLFDMISSGVLIDKKCTSERNEFVVNNSIEFSKVQNSKRAKNMNSCLLIREVWSKGVSDDVLVAIIKKFYKEEGIIKCGKKHIIV